MIKKGGSLCWNILVKLVNLGKIENEEHFLLHCACFEQDRQIQQKE